MLFDQTGCIRGVTPYDQSFRRGETARMNLWWYFDGTVLKYFQACETHPPPSVYFSLHGTKIFSIMLQCHNERLRSYTLTHISLEAVWRDHLCLRYFWYPLWILVPLSLLPNPHFSILVYTVLKYFPQFNTHPVCILVYTVLKYFPQFYTHPHLVCI